jgi:uncharacterized iron-regulated membrane protein
MPNSPLSGLRRALHVLHRWIAIGLLVLLVPIAASGALLVWRSEVDALLNPGRYAVTGAAVAQMPSVYLAAARAALGHDLQAVALRFPDAAGAPVTVLARPADPAAPRRFITVYLDPPTARVLDVADFRASFVGVVHRFHENLTIPQFSGRQVVGWAGVGMLILALSGIVLWWPRGGSPGRGFRWRRTPTDMANVHHMFGFWIAIPLALVSATGLYLAFPQTARSLMASFAPMGAQAPRPGAGRLIAAPVLTPEGALAAALAAVAGAQPQALYLPTEMRAGSRRNGAGAAGRETPPPAHPAWRVQLLRTDGTSANVTIDDAEGAAAHVGAPLSGDRAAQRIRWLHEGSHAGPLWRLLIFAVGLIPPLLALTGVTMWWRGRRANAARSSGRVLSPAE